MSCNERNNILQETNTIEPPAKRWRLWEPEKEYWNFKENYIEMEYGTVIKKRLISLGSFSNVYSAISNRSDTEVALKEIKLKDRKKKITNECNILRRLKANEGNKYFICILHEIIFSENHFYIVTELLSTDLERLIQKKGSIPMNGVRSIAYQVLQALWKLGELGIVHANLQPRHILIENDQELPYTVKLVDFMSAVYEDSMVIFKSIQDINYRPPEVILDYTQSSKIDMWSFGCIIAELLSGDILFPGDNKFQQMSYITKFHGQPPDYMLGRAHKSWKYFKYGINANNETTWSLKSMKSNSLGMTDYEVVKPQWSMVLKKLPTWGISKDSYEDAHVDFKEFTDFLECTLRIDPNLRISPLDALKHDFINLPRLGTSKYWHKAMSDIPHSYRGNKRNEVVIRYLETSGKIKRFSEQGITFTDYQPHKEQNNINNF